MRTSVLDTAPALALVLAPALDLDPALALSFMHNIAHLYTTFTIEICAMMKKHNEILMLISIILTPSLSLQFTHSCCLKHISYTFSSTVIFLSFDENDTVQRAKNLTYA
jgi:hypothetical protein